MGAVIRLCSQNLRPTVFAVSVLMVLLLIAGCGPIDVPLSDKGLSEPAPLDRSVPAVTYRLDEITDLRLSDHPLWEKTYDGAAAAAITPDGEHVIIHGDMGADGIGFEVFDRRGQLLWRRLHRTRAPVATNVAVGAAGGDPLFVLMVHDEEQRGTASVVDASGKVLWSRKLEGIATVLMSSDTDRLAFIDYLGGTVALTDRRGRELGSFPLARGGGVSFLGDTRSLLIYDSRLVRIIDAGGRVQWERPVEGGGDHQVSVSPESLRISVATVGADSAIYMFNHRGQLLWNYLLALGGTNRLAFGPKDETLYVYNVGEQAGIFVFESADGQLLWRTVFETGSGGRLSAEQLRVMSDGGAVAHVVENGTGETRWPSPVSGINSLATLSGAPGAARSGSGDHHSLMILEETGDLAGYIPLGADSRVELSADGMGAVVSQTTVGTQNASHGATVRSPVVTLPEDAVTTKVRFIDVDGLLATPGNR